MSMWWLVLSLFSFSCATKNTTTALQSDVFLLKKRVLDVEHELGLARKRDQDKVAITNKRFVSGLQRLDVLEAKLRNMMGLIDALKVGVITGRYPGLDANSESVAGAITDLQMQVEEISTAQDRLLKEFKSLLSLYNKKKSIRRSKKRKKIANLAGLKTAFSRKRFKHVFEDAQAVAVKLQGKGKEEALYLLAESTFKLGKIRDAALHFNELLELNAEGKYVKTAKIRLGDSFRHLGDTATAKLFYQDLLDNHPKSAEASKAAEKLKSLQKK